MVVSVAEINPKVHGEYKNDDTCNFVLKARREEVYFACEDSESRIV